WTASAEPPKESTKKKSRMKKTPRSTALHVLLTLSVGAAACSGGNRTQASGRTETARRVETEPVKLENVRRVIEIVGTLAAADEVPVSPEAAGKVVRVLADLGDRVRTGEVIVELDRDKPQYKVNQQRATLNRSLAKYGVTDADQPLPPVDQTPEV